MDEKGTNSSGFQENQISDINDSEFLHTPRSTPPIVDSSAVNENSGSIPLNPYKKSKRSSTIEKHDSGIGLDSKLCSNPSVSCEEGFSPVVKESNATVPSTPDSSLLLNTFQEVASEQSSPDSGLQGEMSEAIGSLISVYDEGAELSELALPHSLGAEAGIMSESEIIETVSPPSQTLNEVDSESEMHEILTPRAQPLVDGDSESDDSVRTRRKVRHRIVLRSNSDRSDPEVEEAPDELPPMETDAEFDPTPKAQRPTHKWFVCKEVINRQYGQFRNYSNDLYRLRCYSSLHMVERLELMYKMEKHEGCVNSLHFNQSGNRLASTSDDLRVIIWDWSISEPVLIYDSGHRSNVFQVKFLPMSGDCHIVTCARDGQVRMAELSSTGVCKRTRKLAQHHGAIHKLALDPESCHTFLSAGEDGVVFQIDVRTNKPEKVLYCKENDHRLALYTIYNNPTKPYEFAIGGRDRYVRVYDKRNIQDSNSCRKFCPQHLVSSDSKANVTCLVYNHNGKEILASYNDDDIYTFDESHSEGADYTHTYRGHRNNQTVKGVNYFGPKSEFIVSGSDCGNIFFWDHDSEHIVQFMSGDEGGVVNFLEPHPTCPILATSGLDDDIKIWVPSCEHSPTLEGLKRTICSNMKDREDDRSNDTHDAIDGQMLWFLMQQWRRSSRRRGRQEIEESSSESSNEDELEEGHRNNIQCYQS